MDYDSDSNKRRLKVLSQAVTSVDLQKTAAAYDGDSDSATTGLPASAFADPIERRYPVHTKEAAVLSAAYFFGEFPDETGDKHVAKRLKEAADFWSIRDEFDQMASDLSVAKTTPKFALDMTVGGAVLRYFPWHDGPSLEKTAEHFCSNRHNLPYAARQKTAENLMAASEELGVKLAAETADYLDRCCAYGAIDFDKTAEMLLTRAHMLRKQPKHQLAVKKLAQAMAAIKEIDDADCPKLALDAFAAFDEETGLVRRYGRTLTLPEEQLFSTTVSKHAAEKLGKVTLANGREVSIEDIDWDKVAKFDPELAAAVEGDAEKAAEILPTWPRPDADLLVEMLAI